MKNIYWILLVIVSICCFSCEKNKISKGSDIILKEWLGQTIKFPNIQPTFIETPDSLKYDIHGNKKYKILLYVDSTGCIGCKLQLNIWKVYLEELNSEADFLFYFHPKTENSILYLLKYELFNYPVFIDIKNELNKLNNLPSNPKYQCFLLDKDNKILAMGNPVYNFKIWKLYNQIITGKISDKPLVTTITLIQTEIGLNNLHVGKTSETVFVIKNTGTNPLIIQRVESSCGCTVPTWERQPLAVGENTEIKVKITPEEKGYFNKTVTVHCNTEEGRILLKVSGMVE
ncbi:MAG: DUF1573 domain-containing protein [Bacteroidales bacterium]|jgi:hypothetical protein|nr:DUF1573 domain-containing protein [Bacteroidales bacterium]